MYAPQCGAHEVALFTSESGLKRSEAVSPQTRQRVFNSSTTPEIRINNPWSQYRDRLEELDWTAVGESIRSKQSTAWPGEHD